MTKYSLNISGKIDSFTIGLYEIIQNIANDKSIPFFVAGATAREIILYHGYNIKTGTATKDIDFGIKVSSWDQFNHLRQGLLDTGDFIVKNKVKHKLYYKKKIPLDLVPFGKISSKSKFITWPPEKITEMNVLGFEEAYADALWVRLREKPALDIPFASLAGLALMKIISWNDGYTGNTSDIEKRRKNDSRDLAFFMDTYIDADNQERFYSDTSLQEGVDYDYVNGSACLLGRDIAGIANKQSLQTVFKILDRECDNARSSTLAEDMMRHKGETRDYDTILSNMKSLKKGIKEGKK